MSRLQQITSNPAYRQLSTERQRLGFQLSAVMGGVYFTYILTVAFRPQALGARIGESTVMTWGLVAGVSVIALGFMLTVLYVVRANARFDTLTERLTQDVR